MTWDGSFLYEGTGAAGIDRILVVDVALALEQELAESPVLGAIEAPFRMVEDLAVYNDELWTTDEESYKLYRSVGLARVRQHFR